jgi:arylsulfatase A-like enzyme
MQGASWRPLLEGRSVPWRTSWYYEYYEYPGEHMVRPNRGVRTERWKYIEYPEFHGKSGNEKRDFPAEFELYDLATDPDEAHNLFGDPKVAAKVEELRAEMTRLRRALADPDLPPAALPLP